MLRLSELQNAVKLQQTVGQRRYGHFDSDAHKAIGPDPSYAAVARNKHAPLSGITASPPVRRVNKRTGRVTFHSKKK
jgi:hypothetical protein